MRSSCARRVELDTHPEQLDDGLRKRELVFADEALDRGLKGLQPLLEVESHLQELGDGCAGRVAGLGGAVLQPSKGRRGGALTVALRWYRVGRRQRPPPGRQRWRGERA